MIRYAALRAVNLVPLLLGTTILLFGVIQAMPGGPESLLLGSGRPVAPEAVERYREALGVDQPIPVQYMRWLSAAVRGDLGTSFTTGRPVTEVLLDHLPATLELMLAGFVLAALAGLVVGTVGAVRPFSWLDISGTAGAFAGLAMPAFWFALLLQLAFGVWLGWLPVSGRVEVGDGGLGRWAAHLVLPASVLALRYAARWSRFLRDSLRSALESDYVRSARARGLSEARVVGVHAMRNALLPIISVLAVDLAGVVGGAVITETVFAWPGIGRLFVTSMLARDYPVLMGILLLSTVAIVVMNLVADLLYWWADPRIADGSGREAGR